MSQSPVIKDSPANILVVDDMPANLRLLASILDRAGYVVRPVRDGQMALTAVQTQPPDLILLDIMMPGIDGYEVIRRLKADPVTEHIPVIFISALDDVYDKVKSFSLGAVDFVSKPFQAEEVLARVNTHLTIHRLQQQQKEQIAELDAFAHTVAHDLKNPLAYIISVAELMESQFSDELPEMLNDLLHRVNKSSSRAINIIDELLLLASVRKQQVVPAPVHMGQVVDLALDRLIYMVSEFEAVIDRPESWPIVMGHSSWLVEVWVNYMSNGLKYGGRPPRLQLGAERLPDGYVRFWVRDNGDGLEPEKKAVLFTEFVRLNALDLQGYGLGLSIVRRIITKLNGRVGVEGELGEGSLFYFELPGAAA